MASFPILEKLARTAKPGRPLVQLLAEAAGTPSPLLGRLEADLGDLARLNWQVDKVGALHHLVGEEKHFLAGAAEVVALAWLARREVLRGTDIHVAPADTLTGRGANVDGAVGKKKGEIVLVDVKSLQAHFQSFLLRLQRAVEAEAKKQGRQKTKLRTHVRGTPDLEYVGHHFGEVVGRCIDAIPKMQAGEVSIWSANEFRLSARLEERGGVQSKFASVEGEVRGLQDQIWDRCDQVSRTMPFVLVLVRTDMMGLETGDLERELRLALFGGKVVPKVRGIFGSRSLVPAFKKHRTKRLRATAERGSSKAAVQRLLSGVLFLDARRSDVDAVFFRNSYAKHQLSPRLRRALA